MKVFQFSEVNAEMLSVSLAASYDIRISLCSLCVGGCVCESLPTLSREKRKPTVIFICP